jgi:hypothetical protein
VEVAFMRPRNGRRIICWFVLMSGPDHDRRAGELPRHWR